MGRWGDGEMGRWGDGEMGREMRSHKRGSFASSHCVTKGQSQGIGNRESGVGNREIGKSL
ncbi:MAG: hypothetical protein F6K26_52065 [Moorea sp. SIO2I5]|nr:hypothetical protein [Moorena sp. SIO2I5]